MAEGAAVGGREDDSQLLYGGLCSVQILGPGSVGGNVSANGVYSVETSQMHVSHLSTHKLKYA